MRLHRLTEAGLQQFNDFLDSLQTDIPMEWPEHVLTDPTTSQSVEPQLEIERVAFDNRFEAGRYLNEVLGNAGIPGLIQDKGLWAWLSLFYFDQLCPPKAEGRRKPGERARWIPAVGNFRKYYRHLLAGPYRIYRAHRDNPERAFGLLCNPVCKPGDIAEQLAARQELVTNAAIVDAATALYVDPASRQPKRGAAGRGGGSARRLADVLNQFDLTWDLYAMDTEEILGLLPSEFDRFRETAA